MNHTKKLVRIFMFVLFFTIFSMLGYAQEEKQEPDFIGALEEASIVETQIKEKIDSLLKTPRKFSEPEIEEEKKEPPRRKEVRFFVRDIALKGNTLIATEKLRPLISEFENKEQSMADMDSLAKAISGEYRLKGYITSAAYIPAQKMDKGSFEIAVMEGKVGDVIFEGNRYFKTKRLLSYSDIKKQEIFELNDLKTTIGKLNQHPDRKVRAVLRKGTLPGTSDVVFKVKDKFPIHLGYTMDNSGVDSTGERHFGFTLRHTNFLGFDDMLAGGTVFGRDFGSVFTQYLFPLPALKTKIIGGFSHAQVAPKRQLGSFGINSISQTYYFRVENRLLEKKNFILDFQTGFDFKDSRTRMLSTTYKRDRLRVLRLGPKFMVKDRWGIMQSEHIFSIGFHGLGARMMTTSTSARGGVNPNFFKYKGNFTRSQSMPFNTRLIVKGSVQVSGSKLPSSEAFFLGGSNSIRGYPEGDYLGDNGFSINIDYLIPFFFIPEDWKVPFTAKTIKDQLEFVLFLDEGFGKLRGPAITQKHSRNLLGAGGGLRVKLLKHLYGRAEFGYALGEVPLTDDGRFQVHLRLQVEI